MRILFDTHALIWFLSDSPRLPTDIRALLLRQDTDALIMRWGSALLKRHLEQWYLKDGVVEVSAKRVWEDMAKLLYMPRLLGRETLEKSISEGVEGGLFGYAQDKDGGKYVQFAFRQPLFMAYVNDKSLLIEAGAAEAFKRAPRPPGHPA